METTVAYLSIWFIHTFHGWACHILQGGTGPFCSMLSQHVIWLLHHQSGPL